MQIYAVELLECSEMLRDAEDPEHIEKSWMVN